MCTFLFVTLFTNRVRGCLIGKGGDDPGIHRDGNDDFDNGDHFYIVEIPYTIGIKFGTDAGFLPKDLVLSICSADELVHCE